LRIAELDQPMPAVVGHAAGALGEVIEHCLQKRVDERIGSARLLLDALDAATARLDPEPAQAADDGEPAQRPGRASERRTARPRRWRSRLALATAVLGLGAVVRVELRSREPAVPPPVPPAIESTAQAPIDVVLGGFTEQTTEPGIASALGTALRAGVEQSRHVHLMPVDTVRATLRLMRQPQTAIVDRAVGLELCQRTGASALMLPSITGIGARYVIAVEVIAAATGTRLAMEAVEAASRDQLLDALGTLSRAVRQRLGESRDSLDRDPRALAQVTTADIDALRLFTLGVNKMDEMANEDAADLLQQSLARDPDFAMAHAKLGIIYYYTFNQRALGRQHWQQALAHRERLSDREALYVEGSTQWEGSPDKMLSVWQRYAALYPEDAVGFGNLGYVYWWHHNRFREAADAFKHAVALRPDIIRMFHDLGTVLIGTEQFAEAVAVFDRAYATNEHSGRMGRADAYLAAGRHAEALAALQGHQAAGTRNGEGDIFEQEMQRVAIFADLGNARTAEAAAGRAVELARTSGHASDLGRALFARVALVEASANVRALRPVLAELTALLRDGLSVNNDRQLMGRPVPQLALVGAVYARNHMASEARQIRAALAPTLDAHDILLWNAYVALLDGELALAQGDHATAILTLRRGLGAADLFALHGTLMRALCAGALSDEAASELRWLVSHRGQALVEWVDAFFGRELNLLDWIRARDRASLQEAQPTASPAPASILGRPSFCVDRARPFP